MHTGAKKKFRERTDTAFNPVADAQLDAEDVVLDCPTGSRRHLDIKIKLEAPCGWRGRCDKGAADKVGPL